MSTHFDSNRGYQALIGAETSKTQANSRYSTTNLTALSLSAITEILIAGDFNTSGNISLTGPGVIPASLTLTSTLGDISLSNGSGDVILGNHSLDIQADAGSVIITGDIDLSGSGGSDGGALTIDSYQAFSINGSITTQGGNSGNTGGDGGAITIFSEIGSVTVGSVIASGGNGVVGGGGRGGTIVFTPSNILSGGGIPQGKIVLQSNVSSTGGTGAISGLGGTIIFTAGRSISASTSTISSTFAGNNVSISGGIFIAAPNETITILGDLTINATLLIETGDTIALHNLLFNSPEILPLDRAPHNILSNTGSYYATPTVHIFGGNSCILSGDLVPPENAVIANFSGVYTQPEFLDLLTYSGNTILNFDTTNIPINPSSSQSQSQANLYAIYWMGVAEAELSDRLPWKSCMKIPAFLTVKTCEVE